MRHKTFFRRANLMLLAIGLALAASGLLAWALAASAGPSMAAQTDPSSGLSAAASISGTISYVGAVTGTHLVWVGAFTTTLGGPPAYASQRNGPGPYTLTVEVGSYFIYAGMDADDSGGAPNPEIDPISAYAQNPVTVTADAVLTGVDIVLRDPTPPPTGTASISGQISYTGRITVSHNIVVFAGRQGEQGPPAYAAVIPGPGSYTIGNVADGIYVVAAFMDLGDDMGPPAPDEPFGWYDPSGDQQPDPVVVNGGVTATGIDIILHDPTPASQKLIFLPLVTKTYHDLSWFIPDQLAGYPQPMTASFARAEPLDGQAIPGGYAGREWLDEPNQRFVLAMVMSWLTPQAATRQLGLLKPAHAVPAAVGDEGYIGETADTDGEPAFRLLVFRRGSYLVLVGSGVLDHAATAPVQRVIMDLGEQIDARLSGVPASALATALDQDSPAQRATAHQASNGFSAAGQVVIVGNCLALGTDLASLRPAGALAPSTSVTGTLKLDDGTVNGEITLRFDVTDLGPGADCPTCQIQSNPARCHLVEVRVYITKIALGAEDGDGSLRGMGDIMVGGEVKVHFNCNGVKDGIISFVTGELGDIGPNQSKQLEKFLGTVVGCQCPGSSPTTTFDLLVRDNDEGDAADIIQVVEAAVVKSQTNDETVKRLDGLKDLAKNRGQDTTGPDPFDEIRKRSGDDVGEAHRSDPAPIGR